MAIIAVQYEYDATKLDALAAHRPAHRAHLKELHEAGILLASGHLGSNGALIVVVAEDPEAALTVLGNDPLLGAGVIESRLARTWNPVIGPWK